MTRRPLAVLLIACLYLATGVLGLAFHAMQFKPQHARLSEILAISVTELIAIISGVYLLRGSNWARWLALAWMAFHVVLSAFDSWPQATVHALLCVAFAYLLFRPEANEFFRHPGRQAI